MDNEKRSANESDGYLPSHRKKDSLDALLQEDGKNHGGSKQLGAIPTRVDVVLNKNNRRAIQRAASNLVDRSRTSLKCKSHWPQTYLGMFQYNELTRNETGKSEIASRYRQRPQLTFLIPTAEQLSQFRTLVCPSIDTEKYDVSFTTCPKEFTERLGQDEDGNILSSGASLNTENTMEELRKRKARKKK